MNRIALRLAAALFALAVMMGSAPSARGAGAATAPLLATSPFLRSPFPGRTSEESIFDHSSPNYTTSDARIVISTGEVARRNCPRPAPSGTPPPQPGLCKYPGFEAYWSYKLGDWIFYNGHDGIDYGISYRPIYAAADAVQVLFAGWNSQSNHGFGLGLYIKLHHPNGYQTYYGHLSAVNVQACTTPGCASIKQGDVIGVSGTTGNSSGPHLHFSVNNPSGLRIDPYGFRGSQADPWTPNQRESLWISPPDTSAGDGRDVYPSGAALGYPPEPAIFSTIDDGGGGFSESPPGCWKVIATNGSQSQNGSMRVVKPVTGGSSTCRADWAFPGGPPGRYAVYVRIPWVHATSQGAVYEIHAGGGTQRAIVNQAVFPNFTVVDGWIYLGSYDFSGSGTEFVRLTDKTLDEPVAAPELELGADAIRFAPLETGPTFTSTITLTPSITPAPSRTPTPSRTPSPTPTRTATATPSQTRTRTATATPRPTDTRWPTLTRTPTRTPTRTRTPAATPRPSDTRWPTLTRTPTRTPTPTRAPLMIVYLRERGFRPPLARPPAFPTPPPAFDAVAESAIFDRMIATFGWLAP